MSGAQLLGGAGFLLLLAATQAKTRGRFLVLDVCGLVPVTAHYLLLEAPAGAAMSALYLVIDVSAALEDPPGRARDRLLAQGALAALLIGLTWRTAADLAALAGTLAAVVSRQQAEMDRLLWLVVASTAGWGLYGVLAGSVAQVAFSAAYALAALLGIWRIARPTHA